MGLVIGTTKSISFIFLGFTIIISILYGLIQLLPLRFISNLPLIKKLRRQDTIHFFPQHHTDPRPNYPIQLLIPTMMILLSVGVFATQLALPNNSSNQLATYNNTPEKIRMVGTIDSLPRLNENSSTVFVQMEEICLPQTPCQPVSGRAYIVVNYTMDFSYGDQIEIFGKLSSPEDYESFPEIRYLQSKLTFSKIAFPYMTFIEENHGNPIKALLFQIREKGVNLLFQLFPQPESSLLAGILFGEEDLIPTDVETAFRNTSTSHIIVISGFNITILAALCLNLLKRFLNKWQSTLATLLILIGYTIMVGGDAAVSRAAVMGAMGLIGVLFGRRQTGVNSLMFTAAVLCIVNPFLVHDVGFQLSFVATLGLILFSDPIAKQLQKWLKKDESENSFLTLLIYDYLSPLLAAQIIVTPLLIYYFRQFSLVSLPANLLIAPLQPPIMIFGGLSVLLGFFAFPLGKLFSFIAWAFTAMTIRIVTAFNAIPTNSIHLAQLSVTTVLLFYIVIILVYFAIRNKKITLQKLTPPFIATGLVILVLLIWQINHTSADGNLHIHFLDVSQGDAILIQTPHGNRILINGGKSSVSLSNALYRTLPITQHQLDAAIVASPGNTNMGALQQFVQENQTPLVFWGIEGDSSTSKRTLSTLSSQETQLKYLNEKQVISIDKNISLQVLHQSQKGSSFYLEYENLRIFFCLEEERDCVKALQTSNLNSTIFYAPSIVEIQNEDLKNIDLIVVNQSPIEQSNNQIVFLKENQKFELISDGLEMWFLVQ